MARNKTSGKGADKKVHVKKIEAQKKARPVTSAKVAPPPPKATAKAAAPKSAAPAAKAEVAKKQPALAKKAAAAPVKAAPAPVAAKAAAPVAPKAAVKVATPAAPKVAGAKASPVAAPASPKAAAPVKPAGTQAHVAPKAVVPPQVARPAAAPVQRAMTTAAKAQPTITAPSAAPAKPAAPAAAAAAANAPKKNVSARHGFKTNEWIVYPAHGVGRIVAIEEQEIAGISLELFVITFEKDKMTLRVPTGKSQSVGMRKLAEEATVRKAVETLKGKARVKRTMWSRRAQEYEAKINSGDLIAIAEVVRDLYRSESQPEQSYSERQLYEAALDRMARELAAVEKLDERGAVQRITDVLSKSAKGRRAAAEEAGEVEAEAEAETDSDTEIKAA